MLPYTKANLNVLFSSVLTKYVVTCEAQLDTPLENNSLDSVGCGGRGISVKKPYLHIAPCMALIIFCCGLN